MAASVEELRLLLFAHTGDSDEVVCCLQSGCSVDARDKDGYTALMMAARGGHADVTECLLANGADADARDHVRVRLPRVCGVTVPRGDATRSSGPSCAGTLTWRGCCCPRPPLTTDTTYVWPD